MFKIKILALITDIEALKKRQINKIKQDEHLGIKITLQIATGYPLMEVYQFGNETIKTVEMAIENEEEKNNFMFLIVIDEEKAIENNFKIFEIKSITKFYGNAKDLSLGYNIFKMIDGEEVEEICINYKEERKKNRNIKIEKLKLSGKYKPRKQIDYTNNPFIKNINEFNTYSLFGMNNFLLTGKIVKLDEMNFLCFNSKNKIGRKCYVKYLDKTLEMYVFDSMMLQLSKMNLSKELIISGNIENINGNNIFSIKNIILYADFNTYKIALKKQEITYEVR